MKKLVSKFLLSSLIAVLLFASCKCGIEKPWNYEGVMWYSNTPDIIIWNDTNICFEGYMTIDNQQTPISLLWGPSGSFDIVDNSEENKNKPVEDVLYMWGWVDYDENTATLIIEEDYIFDYKYDKIVLYRKDLPKDE